MFPHIIVVLKMKWILKYEVILINLSGLCSFSEFFQFSVDLVVNIYFIFLFLFWSLANERLFLSLSPISKKFNENKKEQHKHKQTNNLI